MKITHPNPPIVLEGDHIQRRRKWWQFWKPRTWTEVERHEYHTVVDLEGAPPVRSRHTFMHALGASACGKVAFYYNGPLVGVRASKHAEYPDGTRPEFGATCICGSCKSRIGLHDVVEDMG